MHLRSLAILEKASISLKKFSERIGNLYKSLEFLNKSLNFSSNGFKKPHISKQNLHFSENAI
jgi:hypothetical protein